MGSPPEVSSPTLSIRKVGSNAPRLTQACLQVHIRLTAGQGLAKTIAQGSVGLVDSFLGGLARERDFLRAVLAWLHAARICVLRLQGLILISNAFHRLGSEPRSSAR